MYRMWLLLIVVFVLNTNLNSSTPLDDYVNTPDPHFSWKLLQTYPSSTYTAYVLNMTSQQWMDGLILEVNIKIFNKFILFSSVILITTNLVALYDYYST